MNTESSNRQKVAEEILILRCQMGDERAFEALYDRHSESLLFYLRRLAENGSLAEDLFQQVWLTVYRKISKLKEPAAFRTWLYRIAHNRAMQQLRRAHFEVPMPEGLEPLEPEPGPFAFEAADISRLHAALQALSPTHREVIALRYQGGMSYEEIAEVTGNPVGTVRSRLYYARAVLKKQMEDSNHVEK
jgi:RNA polymerase sigma-70 factor (ECF subfamily)